MGLPSSISSTEGMVIGFDGAKKTQVAVQTFVARLQVAPGVIAFRNACVLILLLRGGLFGSLFQLGDQYVSVGLADIFTDVTLRIHPDDFSRFELASHRLSIRQG